MTVLPGPIKVDLVVRRWLGVLLIVKVGAGLYRKLNQLKWGEHV